MLTGEFESVSRLHRTILVDRPAWKSAVALALGPLRAAERRWTEPGYIGRIKSAEVEMTLNIKDPEAHKLARRIAQKTGETMTRAVTEALRERLARLSRGHASTAMAEELLAIGRRCAATLKKRPVDHAILLYDEYGLPK